MGRREVGSRGASRLGEEGQDGDASMAADHRDVHVLEGEALELGDKGVGADDVEGGDSDDLLGVVDAGGLEDLGGDGDGGVDGVGDDVEDGLRGHMERGKG